jgi:hypothetical protein
LIQPELGFLVLLLSQLNNHSHQDSSSADKLCKKCAKIPRPEYFDRDSHFPSRTIGKVERIRKNKDRCPFCRLVFSALFNGPLRHSDSDEWTVGVTWNGKFYYFYTGLGQEYDVRIAVIQEEDQPPSPSNYARAITQRQVSTAQVKTWLELCDKHHGRGTALQQTVREEKLPAERPARVIDINTACIVPFPEEPAVTQYVALSYVWGGAEQYKLERQTKDDLMRPGFLDTIADKIPKTIADAMKLVKRLGLKYLWVDVLCLI